MSAFLKEFAAAYPNVTVGAQRTVMLTACATRCLAPSTAVARPT